MPPVSSVPPMTTAAIDVQLGADAVAGIAGAGVRRQHQSGEAGAHAADDVDEHLGARDVQPHEPSRLLVAADGVDGAAEAGVLHDEGADRQRPGAP